METSQRLDKLEEVLFIGNGRESVVTRVSTLESQMIDVRLDVGAVKKDIRESKRFAMGNFIAVALALLAIAADIITRK